MNIVIGIVGINQWEKYTLPLIESIRKYEPDIPIVILDNGSDPPYPYWIPDDVLRLKDTVSYAQALNVILRYLEDQKIDWFLLLNNDIICNGKFVDQVKSFHSDYIHGPVYQEGHGGYLVGHWLAISQKIFEEVGYFDENFEISTFEDVDYSLRAKEKGFSLMEIEVPFEHLEIGTRFSIDGYDEQRQINKEYCYEKHGL